MDAATLERRITALLPLVAESATKAEADRRVTDEVLEQITASGFLAAAVPTSLGGHGLGLKELTNAARLLAHGDPATAWTTSFLALHGWMLSKLGCAGEVFATGPVQRAPAPLAPTGTLVPADGGARVSGRWEWATGIEHADWVLVHAVQADPFAMRFALVPRAEVTVEDTWHTSGMRATGSNTVVLDDVFVPDSHLAERSELMDSTAPIEGDGLAGIPVASVLGLIASAPALGAAEAAVELFRERAATRVLAYTLGDKAAESPMTQVRLATAMADLRATRALWDSAVDDLAEAGRRHEVDTDLRVATRLAAAATVRGARAVISYVAEASGASVYFVDSPLQRLQRDVDVLQGHVIFDWDRTTELAGRYALGFPLRPTDMC